MPAPVKFSSLKAKISINEYFSSQPFGIVDAVFVNELFGSREQMILSFGSMVNKELEIIRTKHGEILGNHEYMEIAREKHNRRKRPTEQSDVVNRQGTNDSGQVFYFSSLVMQVTSNLIRVNIYLAPSFVKGNLFEQLEKSLEILRTKYLLSKIKFEGIHRREILEYPYKALRESIINALIHRNYLGSSTIQVRVYNDRITFLNEGKLPPEVPVEKLKTEHLSKPRNKLLADVFYKAGFIEGWGRGTIEIVFYKCFCD